jgi:DNA polymerase-3 subunit epsilon
MIVSNFTATGEYISLILQIRMYAIIDIETTGGSPVQDKITEVAVFVYDGNKIVNEFVSLVNPERKIPYHITQLTGISNSMVADAPKFYEIAKQLIEITDGQIFVAHNVNFDYNFIKQEFKQLGYDYRREKICTVNLSRKIIPGHRSYSLGKLCADIGIQIEARHRAAGDALATVKLFEHLQCKNTQNLDLSALAGISKKDLHPNFNPDTLRTIPDEAGVYYFYNEQNDLIYIGKSKNIRTRILSHFRNISTKKAIEMRDAIASFDYELTGNELVALLKESFEIKQNKPKYNRAQRRALSAYGLYHYIDSNGYLRFEIARNNSKEAVPIISFAGGKTGSNYLQKLVETYHLCQKLCGLYKTGGACFHFEIMECKGACIGKEAPEAYNARAYKIIEAHKFRHNSFYIIEHGRTDDEIAVIMIENGKYNGYGYIGKEEYDGNKELLSDCIHHYVDDRDVQQILKSYLKNGRPIDLLPF